MANRTNSSSTARSKTRTVTGQRTPDAGLCRLSNTLCRHDRFAEATAMLEEQGPRLKTHGGLPTDQVRLDALRGEILARSGNPREALPILEAVTTHRLSEVRDWMEAAIVAAATHDHASFQRLSRTCWLRFGSTVEGAAALDVLAGLCQQPMDDNALAMAHGLLERADDGSITISLQIHSIRAVLALGDKPGHDRGQSWWITYQAEMRRGEAEALLQAKGIPLPESAAK